MKVNLSQLVEGKTNNIKLDFTYVLENIDEIKKIYDIIEVNPFHVSGKAYKTIEKIYITLEFEGDIIFTCSRCIQEFKRSISGTLESEVSTYENKDEDFEGLYLNGDILDLSQPLQDAITLSLPMKVICKEECKGLCHDCGVNLNYNQCNCNKERIDPRLEKLKNFFHNDKEV